ncbi:hypothetical protein K432DRAFT_298150 [Lepidopterella palustris CBS 459.81]|uniref:DUF3533 domain-containing protein n=1 Tax=Lepidopterella palustris CBS 459.81 TaxID=1314670 RepID=A0A8E2JF52_9PEZI|nr:hypothetical protein K432DRAFT_298150 [Lepidopterella palustris CBS 459.81]
MVSIGLKGLRHLDQKPTLSKANRNSFTNEYWKGVRVKFIIQAAAGGISFMLLFLACSCYLYGSLYKSHQRYHNFRILAVDYDGGVIGKALSAAYEELKRPEFPTLYFHSPEDFPTPSDVYQIVRNGHYWGAIYSTKGASDRLEAGIQGGQAATVYNPNDALYWVWNQQYYTTFAQSVVEASIEQLVSAARAAYTKINGTQAFPYVAQSDPDAVQAFLNPIAATVANVEVDAQDSVFLFTSISMVMPVLQQFFFLLALNGVSREHQLYSKMSVRSSMIIRGVAGLLYTFGAALTQAGYYWAFRDGWKVDGNQFVLTWMVLWLLMHTHFTYLDAISAITPISRMPFAVLTWIFLNISTTISPLELQPGFYYWGICLPASNAYSVLVTIWSGGGDNRLYRALPIMFAWWIVGNLLSMAAHLRACHLAYKFDKEQQNNKGDGESAMGMTPVGSEVTIRPHSTNESAAHDDLQQDKTLEEQDLEQRQIYGPSIPPPFA